MISIDFYGRKLHGYKANLHTHTTASDGKFTADEVIRRYREAGYDVLAFTDHWTTNPVHRYDGQGMTLLSGIEQHPAGPHGTTWHFLALGVPEDFADASKLPAQETVNRIRAAGGLCFAAHPYWCGLTCADVLTLEGLAGIEVYNASTRYIGKENNSQIWDDLLDAGRKFPALAVDDIHTEQELFHGYTMIASEDPSPAALLNALRAGHSYSSCGPDFTRLEFDGRFFRAEFTPCVEAVMIANCCFGTMVIHPDGTPVTAIEFDTRNLPEMPNRYCRCRIRDAAGNFAWSNPVYLP